MGIKLLGGYYRVDDPTEDVMYGMSNAARSYAQMQARKKTTTEGKTTAGGVLAGALGAAAAGASIYSGMAAGAGGKMFSDDLVKGELLGGLTTGEEYDDTYGPYGAKKKSRALAALFS